MALSEITPEEIRAIRQRLGLTQSEAGEVIGGGPRAFTKYEAGTVTPAASVVNLLRLLDANPGAMHTLIPNRPLSSAAGMLSPFEVAGDHIAALTQHQLPELLRRLLHAEAASHGIPHDGIHVASNIDAPDGGEDGRIEWQGEPERTKFIPAQLSQFQLKAGETSPADAGDDVLTPTGEVKEMVRSALDHCGHYIMLCAHSYTQQAITRREKRIRKALRNAGLDIADEQVHFRDADQIASWVNHHPPVAVWVRERTTPGTIGPFRSWSQWAARSEHNQTPWVEDDRLPALRARLLERVSAPGTVVRLVGLPGVGQSRLVLESLARDTETVASWLNDFVLYATPSEAAEENIKEAVQSLADHGQRAILVVDDCDSQAHQILAGMVSREGSGLSLITIDREIPPGTLSRDTIKVDEAPGAVTEAIISQLLPGLPAEDHRRLAHFSRGFPGIAIRVGQAWDASVPLAHAADDTLVDAFVLGRQPQDPDSLLMSAQLLATFGVVGVEHATGEQLGEVAALGSKLSGEDFYAACAVLTERGVARRRGRTVLLQPSPIAMNLAERRWKAWPPARRDQVLSGTTSYNLKVQAARRLALLNTTATALAVVEHVCRDAGPFDSFEQAGRTGHAEVLSSLAEVSPSIVARRIGRILDDADDLQRVGGELRRNLVRALEKIAFHADTFEEGALLLLRLAVAENEMWANNASGQFKELFPMLLGGTEAAGDARIEVLRRAGSTDDLAQLTVVAEALSAGARMRDFQRTLGVESQGSSPALQPWVPATNAEASAYISDCVTLLGQVAERDDKAGKVARTELSVQLGGLVLEGLIDAVEGTVLRIADAVGYWPEAAASLGDLLAHDMDDMDPATTDRVKVLVAGLQPKTLDARIRAHVTTMRWDYRGDEDFDTQQARAIGEVREVAQELIEQPAVLESYLPQLSRGHQQMGRAFGEALADLSGDTPCWLERLAEAVSRAPAKERNFDLLSGYFTVLASHDPDTTEAFKRRVARSSELAPALPELCIGAGVAASDIALVIGSLQSGLLPPSRLSCWSLGGALKALPASTVAPLFDAMLDHSAGALVVAVDLMAMYAFGDLEKLDGLRPQVVKLAQSSGRSDREPGASSYAYHFERVMEWILAKGRTDHDASTTALALARAMVSADELGAARPIAPLVPTLLSRFPEVVWPLIGQAILSEPQKATRARLMLGDTRVLGPRTNPAILHLPEDTLFAWCHAHPAGAPSFTARIAPVLEEGEGRDSERSLHPLMTRLLDEFGDREDVLEAIDHNINSFGWAGSRTTYYAQYEEPLSELSQHQQPKVRDWAKSMLHRLRVASENARREDEEREASWEV